ncbi:hypothetical protein HET73_07275, partial [Wolbachia endosymbiont of Atemnus politus]|nr:hypothetical protein [Wolbachia endosymbiont of Atemnus politus]
MEVKARIYSGGLSQENRCKILGNTSLCEKGKRKISIKRLYSIAEALSVSIMYLIPTISNEKSYLENEGGNILDPVEKHEKFENQEFRNVIYSLIKSTRANKENSRKVARVEVAWSLVKAGVSVDIIFQATGLSAEV